MRVGGPRSPGDGPWQEPRGRGVWVEDRAAPRAQLAGPGGRVGAARAAAWTAARGLRGLPCPWALPLALQTQAEKLLDHLHSRQEGGSPALVSQGVIRVQSQRAHSCCRPDTQPRRPGAEDRQQQVCAASRGSIPPTAWAPTATTDPTGSLPPAPQSEACLRGLGALGVGGGRAGSSRPLAAALATLWVWAAQGGRRCLGLDGEGMGHLCM